MTKTENDVEFLQSTKTIDKAVDIFEILAQTEFVEKDQDDDQNQLTLSLICEHIALQMHNIIHCYMIKKVLFAVE